MQSGSRPSRRGRLVVVGCYTIPTPRSTERERKALREISSAAQMTINANRSWQRLELLLAANFGRRDLHVVLTYDDEHLPANRQAAVKRVRKDAAPTPGRAEVQRAGTQVHICDGATQLRERAAPPPLDNQRNRGGSGCAPLPLALW